MPRPFSTSFSHAIDKPKPRTARVHTGLSDPIKQPGFAMANPRRAFYAAEKIERTNFKPASNLYQNNDMKPAERPGAMDAFDCPSRTGDVLYFRNGFVEFDPIPANPKPAHATY